MLNNQSKLARLAIQAIISLGLIAAGVYVLVSVDWSMNMALVTAASGWIGLAVGYWLK